MNGMNEIKTLHQLTQSFRFKTLANHFHSTSRTIKMSVALREVSSTHAETINQLFHIVGFSLALANNGFVLKHLSSHSNKSTSELNYVAYNCNSAAKINNLTS